MTHLVDFVATQVLESTLYAVDVVALDGVPHDEVLEEEEVLDAVRVLTFARDERLGAERGLVVAQRATVLNT